jgi:hypothetical protein
MVVTPSHCVENLKAQEVGDESDMMAAKKIL